MAKAAAGIRKNNSKKNKSTRAIGHPTKLDIPGHLTPFFGTRLWAIFPAPNPAI